MKRILTIFIAILALYAYSGISAANVEKTLGFQGQLFSNNTPLSSSVNATFTFYDAITGGSISGSQISKTVTVSNGYFGAQFTESDTTGVDFNQQLYLEISINGTTLSPRTSINPTVSSLKTFGTFSYASAPTVGPAGSLYFNTTDGALYTSDGTSWTTASSSWLTNGTTTYYTAGNVGIGTSTPATNLEIVGDSYLGTGYPILRLTSKGTSAGQIQFFQPDSTAGTNRKNFGLVFSTYMDTQLQATGTALTFQGRTDTGGFSSTLMALTSEGRLALDKSGGALSPETKFVVAGENSTSSQVTLRSYRGVIVASSVIGGINFNSNDTSIATPGTTTASIQALANTAHTASALGTDLVFTTTNGTTTSEALRILGNGNVGIGTTTPISKLEVVGSGGSSIDFAVNGRLQTGDASGAGGIWLNGNTRTQFLGQQSSTTVGIYNGGDWRFSVDNQSRATIGRQDDGVDKLYIYNSGATQTGFRKPVGVGVRAFSTAFGSNSIFEVAERITYDDPTSDQVRMMINGTGDIGFGGTITTNTLTGAQMVITSAGNVGIGTTTPGYQFTVDGNAFANSIYLPNSSGTSTGVIYLGTTPFITNYGGVNTFIGSNAGNSTTTANNSVAVGYQSQMFVISGGANTSVGHLSLGALTTGTNNTALGQGTLRNITDSANNVAVGRQALNALINAGGGNTVIGGNAAMTVQNSTTTTAIGFTALLSSTDAGSEGVFIGNATGRSISGGTGNTFLGTAAGGTGTKTGSYNVLIGRSSGSNLTTGSNNIVIGSNNLFLPSATGNNQLNIGNLIYGTGLDGVTSTLSSGNIGIGTSTPGSKFTVAGAINSTDLLGGATTLSTDANGNIIRTPSDQKLKTNVETLTSALDKVNQMRGVSYNWIDTNRFGTSTEIGFIAQELETIVPEVVKSGGEYKSVNYQNLTALLTEAIKELSAKFTNLSEVVKTKFVDADDIKTKRLCVEKSNGQDVCLNGDQLEQVLSGKNVQIIVQPAPTVVSTPEPEQPVVELDPTPEPIPEPVSEPLPETVTPPTE